MKTKLTSIPLILMTMFLLVGCQNKNDKIKNVDDRQGTILAEKVRPDAAAIINDLGLGAQEIEMTKPNSEFNGYFSGARFKTKDGSPMYFFIFHNKKSLDNLNTKFLNEYNRVTLPTSKKPYLLLVAEQHHSNDLRTYSQRINMKE